jgi:glutathione synthase
MGEGHDENADKIKHLFQGIWSLDDWDSQGVKEVIEKAIENPHSYVIKPMKEGGGNNFYDEEVKTILTT